MGAYKNGLRHAAHSYSQEREREEKMASSTENS